MYSKFVKFTCPNCKKIYKYNPHKLREFTTDNGRLNCKISNCDYILTEEETCKILKELFLKVL